MKWTCSHVTQKMSEQKYPYFKLYPSIFMWCPWQVLCDTNFHEPKKHPLHFSCVSRMWVCTQLLPKNQLLGFCWCWAVTCSPCPTKQIVNFLLIWSFISVCNLAENESKLRKSFLNLVCGMKCHKLICQNVVKHQCLCPVTWLYDELSLYVP